MSPTWPVATFTQSKTRSSLIAILACIGVLPIAWTFDAPSSSFLLAIMVASFIGTRLSGYLCAASAIVLFDYLFLFPRFHIVPHGIDSIRLATFIVTALLIPELTEVARRIERKRLSSEADFRSLIQTCPDAILLLDHTWRIVGLNPATISLFGYTEAILLGSDASLILPKAIRQTNLSGDIEAMKANGERLKISATCGRLGDKTSIFLRDVTERWRIETELKASEEKLRLLVETLPGLVYIRDAQGTLQQVNHRVSEYNGVSLPQLLRDNGLSAVHPEDRSRVAEFLNLNLAAGEPFSYEFRHHRHDGVYRWFQASIQPLKGESGDVIRWYTLLTDIDDRKTMEASLRSMQARLAEASRISTVAEITASVVHEISQPLSAIINNAQACIRYLSSDAMHREAVDTAVRRILRDGKDASQTIKNIRALFRRKDPGKLPIDLREVIDEVLLLHREQIRQLEIDVMLTVGEVLPPVPGDKLQIQQVLVNLVCNAIESMEDSSGYTRALEIRAYEDKDMILTEIADRGHGLPDPDKVFDAFFTTKETGMGMGLRICKTIVEAHEGQLWATPRPDRGAIFTFSLPLERQIYVA